jgi:hypothetical protein
MGILLQNPLFIRDLVKENPDGTVTVTFKEPQGDNAYKDTPVTVTPNIPARMRNQTAKSTTGTNSENELISLIVKAYAKWKGGYQNINMGDPSSAFSDLTGKSSQTWKLNSYVLFDYYTLFRDNAATIQKIMEELQKGNVLTAVPLRINPREFLTMKLKISE